MPKIYKNKILFIVIALCQFGCFSPYILVYHQKDFKPHSLDIITVLPVADARRQVFQKGNFGKEIEKLQQLIVKKLDKKGYTCKAVTDTNAMENIQPTQIPFLDASRISEIGPSDANWILLPVVLEYHPVSFWEDTPLIGAEIACYLFEKPTGKLMWEGSAIADKLEFATINLMYEFPQSTKLSYHTDINSIK